MVEWNFFELKKILDIVQDFADEVVRKKDRLWVQSIVVNVLLAEWACFGWSYWGFGVGLAHTDYFFDDHIPYLLTADRMAEMRKAELLIDLNDLIFHLINIDLIELRRKKVIDLLKTMVVEQVIVNKFLAVVQLL